MSIRKTGKEFLVQFANEFDSHPSVWLILFGIFYLILVMPTAFRRFWYDELFTYNVATLPSFRAMWDALAHGADLNPPFFYVVTHAAVSLLGPTEFALRTPAIAGFLILCCCLYVFVARRAGACYGFIAMLLPIVTGAFRWAPEARAYGLMLGMLGLALVSWQRAAEAPSRRMIPLGGLVIALTAALLTHCFAVLTLAPFFLAQLVRDYGRRKIDWPMWICIAVPLTACITYLPLLAVTQHYDLQYRVFEPGWHSVVEFSETILAPALWPVLAGMVVVAFGASQRSKIAAPTTLWKTEEIALAGGFLLVPILAIALAKITLGLFMVRYGISAIIAVAVLFAQAAATLTGRSKLVGAAVVLVVAGFAAGRTAVEISDALAAPADTLHLDQQAELPLVVASGLIFYPMTHYASPEQAARLWFLTDEKIALRVTGSNMLEKGLPALDRLFPMRGHLQDYHEFLAAHPRFLVYGYADNQMDWLIPQLRKDGAQLRYVGKRNDQLGLAVLYDVVIDAAVRSAMLERGQVAGN